MCTYSGQRIKTRKRNIAAPLDPAAFADAVVQIYLDNAGDLVSIHLYHHIIAFIIIIIIIDSYTLQNLQELIAKCIESSDLNFSRYGDTFFEVRSLFQLLFCRVICVIC